MHFIRFSHIPQNSSCLQEDITIHHNIPIPHIVLPIGTCLLNWFEQSLRSEEMPLFFALIEQIGEVYSNYRLILRVKSERIDCNRQRETYLQRKKPMKNNS